MRQLLERKKDCTMQMITKEGGRDDERDRKRELWAVATRGHRATPYRFYFESLLKLRSVLSLPDRNGN